MLSKDITVKKAGQSGNGQKIEVTPEMTKKQVMDQAGLKGFDLTKDGGIDLKDNQPVFPVVRDGEVLWANLPPELGSSEPSLPFIAGTIVLSIWVGRKLFKRRRFSNDPSFEYLANKGWRREGRKLMGWYQTIAGNKRGEIDHGEFYIYDPPEYIKKDNKWDCIRERGAKNRFRIHFARPPKTLADGVIGVEKLIVNCYVKHQLYGGAK